jgi:PIN domain nuclease of toxin-antitoxin system
MILLDTHYLVWWLLKSDRISDTEEAALIHASEAGELYVSAISFWEIDLLVRKGKIRLKIDFEAWLAAIKESGILKILPVDEDVIVFTRRLPESFHADPADRFIAATALYTGLALLTADRKIIQSEACRIWSAD